MIALEELALAAHDCVRCPLAAGRTQVVWGMGDPNADLMFVGEGPGAEEDKQGLPFVGRSGQLLDRLVQEEMGLDRRTQCYTANVVKCLRYNAAVQLADGSWDYIGRLVRQQYDGFVMSLAADGTLVPRRVTGWHASPLGGRRVFRLTYRNAKGAGSGRVSVQVTGDHEVMTERGWVAAQDLVAGDRIATGQGLSAAALDVVRGTLLGDGHLNASSAHLSFSHSARQAPYASFKAQCLSELTPHVSAMAVAAVSGGDRSHDAVHVRTRAHRSLRLLRAEWYGPSKRVPPSLATSLTPRALAIWFMDDGHMRVRPPRQPSAEIATCSFTDGDLQVLLEGLARLGLHARALRGRLHFDVLATRALSRVIAPYVPPSMRSKLHPDDVTGVPFDASLYEPGPSLVMYDEVESTDVTDQPRTDTTFFCIDVEETNNFVTAGGVVHNCRPPGNRDPKPDEIAKCRPWLNQQVDTIRPRVVVTLGRFAAQVLLETTEGITKLRGKQYPFRNGILIPTFHPAAVLRGGAEPMAHVRADLVRAKLALAAQDA